MKNLPSQYSSHLSVMGPTEGLYDEGLLRSAILCSA